METRTSATPTRIGVLIARFCCNGAMVPTEYRTKRKGQYRRNDCALPCFCALRYFPCQTQYFHAVELWGWCPNAEWQGSKRVCTSLGLGMGRLNYIQTLSHKQQLVHNMWLIRTKCLLVRFAFVGVKESIELWCSPNQANWYFKEASVRLVPHQQTVQS